MLKKSLLLMTLASSIFAGVSTLPKGQLQKLNANYVSPRGTGNAQYVNFEEFGEYTKPTLEVENYNGLLIFSIEDKTFELDLSLLGVTDADRINISNLNFTNQGKKINLNLSQARALDDNLDTNINNASIDCTRKKTYQDITDDLLSACLSNSSIRAGSFRFKSQSEFESLIDQEVMATDMTLDGLKINISNGRLKAQFKSNLSKGMKVKLEGYTSYNSDEKKITIKITKAKAGFFSVRGTIFKALRKAQSKTMRVVEPYIYIDMSAGQ